MQVLIARHALPMHVGLVEAQLGPRANGQIVTGIVCALMHPTATDAGQVRVSGATPCVKRDLGLLKPVAERPECVELLARLPALQNRHTLGTPGAAHPGQRPRRNEVLAAYGAGLGLGVEGEHQGALHATSLYVAVRYIVAAGDGQIVTL